MTAPFPKPATALDPDGELPFWRRKAMKEMTREEWGGLSRRRPLLLDNSGGRQRPHLLRQRRLPAARQLPCRCTDYQNRSEKVKDCVTLFAAQHQPHLLAAADLRLSPRRRRQGFILVASAGVRRPRDRAHRPASQYAGKVRRPARRTCRTLQELEDYIVSWPLRWPKGARG